MKLISDIDRVKKLAKRKEEENWGFRSFLKTCGVPPQKIDCIAQKLYKRIAAKIDCRLCNNCCREVLPVLVEDDIAVCSAGLKIPAAEFKDRYLAKTAGTEDDRYTFNKKPCPFLTAGSCSVYDFRPADCRSYPHIERENLVSRLIGVIRNCSVCPIVFNVYESLKTKIWAMDADADREADKDKDIGSGSAEWEEFI